MQISEKEFNKIREYIKMHSGNHIADSKKYLVVQRLKEVVIKSGCLSFDEYIKKINNFELLGEKNKIIDAITTNETSFFRDELSFEILNDKIIPEVIKNAKLAEQEEIIIWSSAVSSGQEIYSLAITIYEYCQKNKINFDLFKFIGTDISEQMVIKAQKGAYSSVEIKRGLNDEIINKYFDKKNNSKWVIKEFLKKNISIHSINLAHSFSQIPKADLIFCKNVLIYFDEDFQTFVLKKIREKLKENGHLFIGSMEKGYKELDSFKIINIDNIQIYKKKS